MTPSDRPGPAAYAAPPAPPPTSSAAPAGVPLGAEGGFPPPPPPGDEPAAPATGTTTGTNTMAVLGLVFAFLVPVLGAVFSVVGLVQTRRRGQPGRRLAVAGLVVSLVLVAAGAVALAVVGPTTRRAAPPPSAGAPVPAGNPAHEAVVAACARVMPALGRLETDLGGSGTLDQVADRVTALQRQVGAAAAASGDAAFAAHARALAADFGRLVDTARGGGDPAAVVDRIGRDGTALGQDCGAAGWLP